VVDPSLEHPDAEQMAKQQAASEQDSLNEQDSLADLISRLASDGHRVVKAEVAVRKQKAFSRWHASKNAVVLLLAAIVLLVAAVVTLFVGLGLISALIGFILAAILINVAIGRLKAWEE
jgi:Flp pilus assembly protein TadB